MYSILSHLDRHCMQNHCFAVLSVTNNLLAISFLTFIIAKFIRGQSCRAHKNIYVADITKCVAK